MPLLLWASKACAALVRLKSNGGFFSSIMTRVKAPDHIPELTVAYSFSPATAGLQYMQDE